MRKKGENIEQEGKKKTNTKKWWIIKGTKTNCTAPCSKKKWFFNFWKGHLRHSFRNVKGRKVVNCFVDDAVKNGNYLYFSQLRKPRGNLWISPIDVQAFTHKYSGIYLGTLRAWNTTSRWCWSRHLSLVNTVRHRCI
jgi:hypothetical protein